MNTTDMNSICILHNDICVTFYSDDNDEIEAIKNCFGYFWAVKDFLDSIDKWTIVSSQVSSIRDIIDINKVSLPTGLFRNSSVKKAVIDKKHYYVHNMQGIDCLTCFDLENKLTYFFHPHKISEYSYIRNLVREPFVAKYQELGHVALHASACSIGDNGILIPGPEGSGKSTLLFSLLEYGASYLGNDAVLCKKENDSITLVAPPQCIRLSKETALNNKSLSKFFSNTGDYYFINNKLEFTPNFLERIFPTHHLIPTSKLKLLIIPTFDLSTTDYYIESNNNYYSLLQNSLFNQYHNYVWSPFFHRLNDPSMDIYNFNIVFEYLPKVCYLRYGILNHYKQKKLYDNILSIIN